MTIVAFSRARFTPGDIAAFDSVAESKIELGHWAEVVRQSGRDFDHLLVTLPGADRPIFRFERNGRGGYALSFNDRSGWYAIGAGATAAECLAIWRPRSPRAQPVP